MHRIIERRMFIGFGLVTALLIFTIWTSSRVALRRKDLHERVLYTRNIQTQLEQVQSWVEKSDWAENNLLFSGTSVTGTPGNETSGDRKTDDCRQELCRLGHLMNRDAAERTAFSSLRTQIAARGSMLAQLNGLIRDGRSQAARQLLQSEQGRQAMQGVEDAIEAIRHEERNHLQAQNDDVNRYERDTDRIDFILRLIMLGALAVVFVGVRDTSREMHAAHQAQLNLTALLAAQATTDDLTGLKNHRAFEEKLAGELERARRYRTPLSLILLDVDKFKAHNDTFGHPAGDHALKTVAAILMAAARDTDFVARYGGEEFMVILPNTDAKGSAEAAERFRTAIEAQQWDRQPITASFGVATVGAGTPTPQSLVAAADRALYASKTAGRNRVTHTDTIPPEA